ncbi:hypothetical protein KFL_000950190 [Klebsormidium nitens]|uniref:Uncharacterized protein n=1 Tax=Klebsormidium nitens TaxID=105231 RepID=A0A1Y1HUW9_KLENI|nr:hypothetical protein KFL_000950190 [Klebsormidium nitens]|eukprot:GAQ81943.1 hypothetical protein KFL_000950190 [Klebsormidium nitens]
MALSHAAEVCSSGLFSTTQNFHNSARPAQPIPLASTFFGSSRKLDQKTWSLITDVQKSQRKGNATRASAAGSGNSFGRFFKKVLNSTPILGLVSNLAVDAGNSFVHYSQFGRQVADKATRATDEAFADLEAIHGKPARFGHVLFCCWIASSGAGLLRRDDVLVAAKRLRYSLDLQFEVENQERLMQEAVAKVEKLKKPFPDPPLVARMDVAVQTLCKCCIGRDYISEEDSRILQLVLKACFSEATSPMIEDVLRPYLERDNEVEISSSDAVTT